MSFGLRDEDWIDPDEGEIVECRNCENWNECPENDKWGWCESFKMFTDCFGECEV